MFTFFFTHVLAGMLAIFIRDVILKSKNSSTKEFKYSLDDVRPSDKWVLIKPVIMFDTKKQREIEFYGGAEANITGVSGNHAILNDRYVVSFDNLFEHFENQQLNDRLCSKQLTEFKGVSWETLNAKWEAFDEIQRLDLEDINTQEIIIHGHQNRIRQSL